ncbi:MAG: protein kinase [Deltaproteobacteria bacterium]|nr:protein kinase [Deltaproteobacteria bacterium]
MAGVDFEVGTVIDHRFVLDKKIGTGGFGSVWRALDKAGRDAPVALKLLHAHHHADPRIRARFEREAQVLSSLDHPSIAKCLAWDLNDEAGYLALEYVDGVTLARAMVHRVREHNPFELREVRRIFSELCAAVQFAHQQDVVHRDIKPANIMLLERAGTLYVKVLDFGVAKILAEASREHTTIGTLLGSLHYMGPEQAKGQPVDARTDVFALGSVLFEMLTLRRAWLRNSAKEPIQVGAPVKNLEVENNDLALIMRLVNDPRPVPTHWRADLPPAIDAVIAKALAVEPDARYPSVEALAMAVDEALSRAAPTTGDLPEAPPTKPSPRPARPERAPTPTPAPREQGHTFETSRPEAFLDETAALWSRVDEALVREAEASQAVPPSPSRRGRVALWVVLALAVAAAGALVAAAVTRDTPAPTPPPGRIVDVP